MKKNLVKRMLSTVLIVAMLGSLTACGGSGSGSESEAETEAETADTESSNESAEVNTDEKVEVTVFHFMTQDAKMKSLTAIEEKFTEKYPNVTFNNIYYNDGTDYYAQLETALAAGDMPEIIMGSPSTYAELVEEGLIMDLSDNEVINSMGISESFLGDASVDGKVYAFPIDYTTGGFYYNKALFEENGWEVPKTKTELLDLMQTIADSGVCDVAAEAYSDGCECDINLRDIVWAEAVANGDTDMFEKIMNGEATVHDYEYFADALEYWQARIGDWARPDATTNSQSEAGELFASGEVALYYEGTWATSTFQDVGADYGFFFMPVDDEGTTREWTLVDQIFMVCQESAHPEWGQAFMEFWLSECASDWTDSVYEPNVTGDISENALEIVKIMNDKIAAGDGYGHGDFTVPLSTAYTSAYRQALTAFAMYCCTGQETNGVNSVETCLDYMQELFDEERASQSIG